MGVYERFFKLHDEPFRLTPDPRYLFPSGKHREVLAHLRLGVTESSGFVCITGDVGTGKTTLVRTFLDQLEPGTSYAYIFNPPQTPIELLQTINSEFGLRSTATTRKALVDELNAFLLAERRAGRRALVVVDEAQAVGPEVLEELRLLSNLETATAKLLQIILFGQPQLAELLQSADLAQLNQRITLRWHLGPLSPHETAAYVRHRLRVAAGGVERALFSSRSLSRIHHYTRGIPRLINMFCHRCMLAAFAAERRSVTARMVEQVHDEIQRIPLIGNPPRASRGRGLAWAAGGAAFAALMAWALVRPNTFHLELPLDNAAKVAAPASIANDIVLEVEPSPEPAEAPRISLMTLKEDRIVPPPSSTDEDQAGSGAAADGDGGTPATQPVPEPDPFLDSAAVKQALLARTEAASIVAAIDANLERWGERPLAPRETVVPIDLDAITARRGLHHLPIAGTINMLRVLNLPAIVELMLPEADGPRYALLEGLRKSTCVLALHEESLTVERAFVDEHWLGQAHIIWKDFERLAPMLQRGSSGPRVGRLQEMLSNLGFYHGPINRRFGEDTESAVAAFQRSRRLFADALVGQLTRIALYNALGSYAHPRLVADVVKKSEVDA